MAGRIPQKFIDELLDRVDIVEIIDGRVKLRKTGRNYSALCPFHQEKTPSFSVNPDKQFYYCFGCGAGGNVLGFLIDYERMDFPVAVEELAKHAGMMVPRENAVDSKVMERRADIFSLLEKSSQYFQEQLSQHPQAGNAVEYLKNRGLSGKIAKQFGIGYAPPGWDNLLTLLGQNETDRGLLIESGMLISKDDGGCYDRFRHRIMFPIRDNRGRTIAFGGRVLGDDKPKYLNSPETSVFFKKRELYGLVDARRANNHLDCIMMVEGYMDVVALAQHGINNAVATLGTATSEQHLEKVFRHCNDVVFCFDGDAAGLKAANSALDTCLPFMQDGRQARFLFLPDGEDPDSLVRKIGADQFRLRIEKAVPLSDYLFDSISADVDISSLDGQAKFSKLALPKVNLLPDGVFRRLMLNQVAQRCGLSAESLDELLTLQKLKSVKTQAPTTQKDIRADSSSHAAPHLELVKARQPVSRSPLSASNLKITPAHQALSLLIYKPHIAQSMRNCSLPKVEDDSDIDLLLQLINKIWQEPSSKTYSLLGYWLGSAEGELLTQLLANRQMQSNHLEDEKAKQELEDCLKHLIQKPKEQIDQNFIAKLEEQKDRPFSALSPEEQEQLLQICKNPET